ncbi:MAG: hypothetical protein J7501_16080, partial [Bdellovibrio sp.]|nr:hypothetical protein [Bdellovibrio sp.]
MRARQIVGLIFSTNEPNDLKAKIGMVLNQYPENGSSDTDFPGVATPIESIRNEKWVCTDTSKSILKSKDDGRPYYYFTTDNMEISKIIYVHA